MLIAGICGTVYRDGLEIDILRVAEAPRRSGIGAQRLAVLAGAEACTRTQGAEIAFLRPVAARDYYRRTGNEMDHLPEDQPPGSRLYHGKNGSMTEPGSPINQAN